MNPMKVTAVVVMILGGIIAAYATTTLAATPTGDALNGTTPPADPSLLSNPWVLFPFAAVAIAVGLGMLLFGGSGVIRTRNPAVRR